MNSIFGMDEIFVRRRIFQQTLARTAGNRLVSRVHVEGLLGLRVNHPDDFLNVVCHLLEPFFGVELHLLGSPQRSRVKGNQNGKNSGSEKQECGE